MPLLNAAEDLRKRTLARLSGSLARLRYLGELRSQGHSHWGLQQRHDREAVGAAIRENHTEEFVEVLRTDLDQLVEDFPQQEESVISADGKLPEARELEPENAGGGSRRHLSGLMYALSKVMAWRRGRGRTPGA
jgi:hypothetical protein